MKKAIIIISTLGSLAIATAVYASGAIGSTYLAPFKQNRIELRISPASPAQCDGATIKAAQNWNAVMTNFQYAFTGPRITSVAERNAVNVTYITQAMMYSPQTIAQAANLSYGANGTRTILGTVYPTTDSGRLWGNSTRLANGQWDCNFSGTTPSSMYDIEYIMTHELGHNIGMGHRNLAGCVMRPAAPTGEQNETLCSSEIWFAQKAYP